MDNKIIIEKLVEQVKNGTLTIDEIPQGWREKVLELLEGE